jgi:CheY-like chemotaxis protein
MISEGRITITWLLTEAMGGELTFTSTPGKGSCFSVRQMLSPVPSHVRRPGTRGRAVTGYEGPRRRILAVDDDPHQTTFLREGLSALGFEVITAANGADGVMLALAQDPDAVLLDVNMPGLTGWETAAQLREGLMRRVPIIMVSAYAPEHGAMVGAAGHHDAYLMKPVRMERLLDLLGRHLGLDWIYAAERPPRAMPPANILPDAAALAELRQLGRIGHLQGILTKLDALGAAHPDVAPTLAVLRRFAEDCDLDGYRAAIEAILTQGEAADA